VSTFFGTTTTQAKSRTVMRVANGGAGDAKPTSSDKKPRADTYLMDKFVIEMCKKKDNSTKKEVSKALEKKKK
jgi:hypothetical protein